MSLEPGGAPPPPANIVERVTAESLEKIRIGVQKTSPMALALIKAKNDSEASKKEKKDKKKRRHSEKNDEEGEEGTSVGTKRKKNERVQAAAGSDSDEDAVIVAKNKKKGKVEVMSESDADSDAEKKKKKAEEVQEAKRKEEELQAKKKRKRLKEERQKQKEKEEKRAARRKKEVEEAEKERKRKKVAIGSDDEQGASSSMSHFANDEMSELRRRRGSSQHSSTPSSTHSHLLKARDCRGKTREQLLAEFNCIQHPHSELKEFNDFCDERDMLREYGESESYLDEFHSFPEEQLLTCDSQACPFLLTYQTPFSALYSEVRKRWTPPINDIPTSSHLRNKCVNCDRMLSMVPEETWRTHLGGNSYYCSVKCVAGKVNRFVREHPDAETVTVMNALTGDTVRAGVYTRELRSFFLLAPHWMPFSTAITPQESEPPKKKPIVPMFNKQKEEERRKAAMLAKPIPKQKPDTTESLRKDSRLHLENAMNQRVEKMKMKGVDRKQLKEIAEQIELKLFQKCNGNMSTPKYRSWKQQFIHNFDAESARDFVLAVVLKRIPVEKLVEMDANSLRNPLCWKTKPVGEAANPSPNLAKKKKFAVARNPLDAIIGDDTRDTTAEHMSHSFSKTCRTCQAKTLAEAKEKMRQHEEDQDVKERRARTRELREAMRKEALEQKKRAEEERMRRRQEDLEERERLMRDQEHQMNRTVEHDDDDDFGGGGGWNDNGSPTYDVPGSSDRDRDRGKDRERGEERPTSSRDHGDSWEFPIRIYMAQKSFDSTATPIFAQTSDNRSMFRLFEKKLADNTFDLHTPLRIPNFLYDSNKAMNESRSCVFAVLKLMPAGSSKSYQEVLDYNLDQETVYQLRFEAEEEIISIFLFPHRGSEILHDTFAPVKYNIGTTENCFMLIMVLNPKYGGSFQYSVRVSDPDMRAQLLMIEKEKMMQTSWRKREASPQHQKAWRDSRSRSPQTPTDPGLHLVASSSSSAPLRSPSPIHVSSSSPAARAPSLSSPPQAALPTAFYEELSQQRMQLMVSVLDQIDNIEEITKSLSDFMNDVEVLDSYKDKMRDIMSTKIEEIRAKKKAEKREMRRSQEPADPMPSQNGAPIRIDFSRPPPMMIPNVEPSSSGMLARPVPPPSDPSVGSMFQPIPVPAPFSFPPPSTGNPVHPQPQYPERVGMTDNEIVEDAIRRGMVAPIPQELLLGSTSMFARGSSPSMFPMKDSLEEDRQKLLEYERRIEMEKRFQKDMDEMEERRRNNRPPPHQHEGGPHSPMPGGFQRSPAPAPLPMHINRGVPPRSLPVASLPSSNEVTTLSSRKRIRNNKRRGRRPHSNSESMDVVSSSSESDGDTPTPPPPSSIFQQPPPPPPAADLQHMLVPPPPPSSSIKKAPEGMPLPVPPPPPIFSPSMICPPPPPPLPSEERKDPPPAVIDQAEAPSPSNSLQNHPLNFPPPPLPGLSAGPPPPLHMQRGRGAWRGGPPPRGMPPMRARGGPPPMRGGRGAPPHRGGPPPMMRGTGGPPMFRGGPPMRGSPMGGPNRGGPQGGFGGHPMDGPPRFFQDSPRGGRPFPPPRGGMNNSWRGGPPRGGAPGPPWNQRF